MKGEEQRRFIANASEWMINRIIAQSRKSILISVKTGARVFDYDIKSLVWAVRQKNKN